MIPPVKRLKLLLAVATVLLIIGVAHQYPITAHVRLVPTTLTDDYLPSEHDRPISPPSIHTSQSSHCQTIVPEPDDAPEPQEELKEPWDSSNFVLGPPGDFHVGTLRALQCTWNARADVIFCWVADNLRNDTYYITSWANAGFSAYMALCAVCRGLIPLG